MMAQYDAQRFAAIRAAETLADNRDPARAVRVAHKALREAGYDPDRFRITVTRPATVGNPATATITPHPTTRGGPGGEPVTETREARR